MAVNPIPPGFHSVAPMLGIRDAAAAIEFYKRAFGAVETLRRADPSGKIAHAEIKIGDSIVMMGEENPQYNASPQTLGNSSVILALFVPDVDAVVSRAVAAGAKVVIPVKDQFYGDRSGRIVDPFGHIWVVSTHKEDVSPQEMQKRFADMMKSG